MRNIDIIVINRYLEETGEYDIDVELFRDGVKGESIFHFNDFDPPIQADKPNLILISKNGSILRLGKTTLHQNSVTSRKWCNEKCLWRDYLSLVTPDLCSCHRLPCNVHAAGNFYVFEELELTDLSLFQLSKLRVDAEDNIVNFRLTNKIYNHE